ncbi:MAG: Eco57I restriction-modification methylase domain-containing protein [Saprospiraceae bacterium]|nr:Eco57I restriction-modification methylase domain-containing protein [Saprospiraceae bacterium]
MPFDFDFLKQPFQREAWKNFIRYVFPNEADLFAAPQTFPELHGERIQSFVQFGNIHLQDRYGSQLALFEVMLKPGTTKLQINRVALRAIIDKLRRDTLVTGAFAVFADEKTGKWRFTFIAKQEVFGEKNIETVDPRRYTYVFGHGETTRTAEQRFSFLASKTGKQLEDVLEAFSVERVSNEFFNLYKEQYRQFCEYLYEYEPAKAIFSKLAESETEAKRLDKQQKLIRDFAKKLMGRLVFLYFLQKKRWLGGKIDSGSWEDGASDFLRQLFEKSPDKSRFYSQTLAPLYFKTLNTNEKERPGFAYAAPWGKVKVPFLNGGLFEEDQDGTELFDFPEHLFQNLLDLYDRYNFTVDENSPNDHEVGIDPEMLGHIFENLLEENREKKGAFYTPKEIVHYLCQESLWQYLKNKLLPETRPANVVWSDSREADERELEHFVRNKERGSKDGFIYKNARAIESALREVRICDPAIGSGAFPMGLLHEIFHCHVELDLTEDLGKLKRDIIEHCIYGVDIEKGAVDIAQLRFWLALVVDENVPRPLPNLDYKIMQGDSLLERFEDIDLKELMNEEVAPDAERGPKPGTDLFNTSWQSSLVFDNKEKKNVKKLLHEYYVAQTKTRKKELLLEINRLVLDKVDAVIRSKKLKLLLEKADLEKQVKRLIELKQVTTKTQKVLVQKESEIVAFEQQQQRLHQCLHELEKPFFLWRLYFDEVLREDGGFDIIIGNPPYVQIQGLKDDYKKWLEQEGYTTFDKGSDLYALFYERGWQQLRPGGHLAFITSNKWMRANYGETLRQFFLQKTNPLKLLDFGMAQNFASALTYTSIVIFQKGNPDHQIEICRAQADYQIGTDVHQYFLSHRTNIPDLDTGSWVAYTPDEYRIRKMVEDQGVVLENKETWKITINYGIKTGFNDAFIVKTKDKEAILTRERKLTGGSAPSEALFKKMLRGEDVRAWAPLWNDLWLIGTFPSLSLKIEDYPGIHEYLGMMREKLEPRPRSHIGEWAGRKSGAYEWFETQDSISYWQDFAKPKIIYPNMTKYLPFAYDETGYFTNQKCFIITGEHLKYLSVVFNSKLFKFCFRQNFPELLGETFELSKVFFDKIPIKVPDAKELAVFEPLAGWLALLHHIARTEKEVPLELRQWAEFFEYLANGLVYELYFGEAMRLAGRDVMRHLPVLPAVSIEPEKRRAALETIGKMFTLLSERTHPVATNLYYMTAIPDIQIIENLKTDVKA